MSSALREVFARFGIEANTAPLQNLNRSVDGGIQSLQRLGQVLTSGLIAGGVARFVNTWAEAAADLDDTSQQLGISTTALQEWTYAARLAGVRAETWQASLNILARNLEAVAEGGTRNRTLETLGVSARDAEGNVRALDDVLPEIAEGFSRLSNPTQKAGLATRLFGRAGIRLVPLLSRGRAGLAQLRAEFQRLGGGTTPEAVAAAAEYGDALDRLDLSVQSLKGQIAMALLPIFQTLAQKSTELVGFFRTLAANTTMVKTAFVALSAVMAVYAANALLAAAPAILTAVALAALALAAEDVYVWLNGGNSVIGEVIDGLNYLGISGRNAEQVALDLADAWEGFKLMLEDVWKIAGVLGPLLGPVGMGATMAQGGPGGQGLQGDSFARMAPFVGDLASNFSLPGQARILGAPAARAASVVLNSPVNITGARDPQETARAVEEALDRRNRQAAQALAEEG
jgi:hypothetical protein